MASTVLPTQEKAITARASALLPVLQACLQLLAAVQCPVRGTQGAPAAAPPTPTAPFPTAPDCGIASSWKPSLLYTPTTHRPFALGDWALQEGRAKITSLAQGRLLGNIS